MVADLAFLLYDGVGGNVVDFCQVIAIFLKFKFKSMSIKIRFAFSQWAHYEKSLLNYCASRIYQDFLPFLYEESILKCKLGKTYSFNCIIGETSWIGKNL